MDISYLIYFLFFSLYSLSLHCAVLSLSLSTAQSSWRRLHSLRSDPKSSKRSSNSLSNPKSSLPFLSPPPTLLSSNPRRSTCRTSLHFDALPPPTPPPTMSTPPNLLRNTRNQSTTIRQSGVLLQAKQQSAGEETCGRTYGSPLFSQFQVFWDSKLGAFSPIALVLGRFGCASLNVSY
ncbi:hypothetical protein RchiOBHm_Chr7g0225881 [Rosa chinensis]|uniref:Uncharacterized protein n=1 Tax=Rosa chinensis TaxID=74649 RepID=A0A2P6PE75_ROSCH|nr:hypothetical protein RchiOBHm_Chr7g0225881 [Rosa chinensis]